MVQENYLCKQQCGQLLHGQCDLFWSAAFGIAGAHGEACIIAGGHAIVGG